MSIATPQNSKPSRSMQKGVVRFNVGQLSEDVEYTLDLLKMFLIASYSDDSEQRIQQYNILNKLQYIVQNIYDSDQDKHKKKLQQILINIQNIEKITFEQRIKTVYCCGRKMTQQTLKFLYCASCGKMCNYLKKSSRKETTDMQPRNTSYHSIRHFDDVFKQLFVQPTENIDSYSIMQLRQFMQRDRKEQVTIEDVRQYLKQLPDGKGSAFNKSDAYIMGILNNEQIKITTVEYTYIKNTFQQLISILYKNADTRKNTPNCICLVKNIIDILYKDLNPERHMQLVKRLHQQKENTTRKIQKLWDVIIQQFDVETLKSEFKNSIKAENLIGKQN